MKKPFLLLASILAVMTSPIAQAAFSIEELHSATKLAVEMFKKENPSHVEHFYGYKSWKSAEESKVKVYVQHEGMFMEFSYVCHKHEDAIECHNQ